MPGKYGQSEGIADFMTASPSPQTMPQAEAKPGKRARQKAQTRQRLIDASSRLFMELGAEQATIDEITAEAGVSRASFYLHFQSKEAVIKAMFNQVGESMRPAFLKLAALNNPDITQLAAWIEDHVIACRRQRPTIFYLQRAYPLVSLMFDEIAFYQDMISLLGEQIPRFRRADSGADPDGYAEAMLFFFELQALVRFTTIEDFGLDHRRIGEAIARRLHRFLHDDD